MRQTNAKHMERGPARRIMLALDTIRDGVPTVRASLTPMADPPLAVLSLPQIVRRLLSVADPHPSRNDGFHYSYDARLAVWHVATTMLHMDDYLVRRRLGHGHGPAEHRQTHRERMERERYAAIVHRLTRYVEDNL